ncbi:MAG: LiaI-LiaF-like domain-containing protein [bacterium]|jgi:hypothetical protein
MRGEGFFLGLLLISAGLLLALRNFGILPYFSLWLLFVRFWPVLLILTGISMVCGRSRWIVLVLFLLLVTALGSFYLFLQSHSHPWWERAGIETDVMRPQWQ